jgi:hypothetical protein
MKQHNGDEEKKIRNKIMRDERNVVDETRKVLKDHKTNTNRTRTTHRC